MIRRKNIFPVNTNKKSISIFRSFILASLQRYPVEVEVAAHARRSTLYAITFNGNLKLFYLRNAIKNWKDIRTRERDLLPTIDDPFVLPAFAKTRWSGIDEKFGAKKALSRSHLNCSQATNTAEEIVGRENNREKWKNVFMLSPHSIVSFFIGCREFTALLLGSTATPPNFQACLLVVAERARAREVKWERKIWEWAGLVKNDSVHIYSVLFSGLV